MLKWAPKWRAATRVRGRGGRDPRRKRGSKTRRGVVGVRVRRDGRRPRDGGDDSSIRERGSRDPVVSDAARFAFFAAFLPRARREGYEIGDYLSAPLGGDGAGQAHRRSREGRRKPEIASGREVARVRAHAARIGRRSARRSRRDSRRRARPRRRRAALWRRRGGGGREAHDSRVGLGPPPPARRGATPRPRVRRVQRNAWARHSLGRRGARPSGARRSARSTSRVAERDASLWRRARRSCGARRRVIRASASGARDAG